MPVRKLGDLDFGAHEAASEAAINSRKGLKQMWHQFKPPVPTAWVIAAALSVNAAHGGDLKAVSEPQLDALAQEIAIKAAGATVCKIEHRLPQDDITTIVRAIGAANMAALQSGTMKGALIVKGLEAELRPTSKQCQIIGKGIDEAKPMWATMAKMLRD